MFGEEEDLDDLFDPNEEDQDTELSDDEESDQDTSEDDLDDDDLEESDEAFKKPIAGKLTKRSEIDKKIANQEQHITTLEAENRALRETVVTQKPPVREVAEEELPEEFEELDETSKKLFKGMSSRLQKLEGELEEAREERSVNTLRDDFSQEELRSMLPQAKRLLAKHPKLDTATAFYSVAGRSIGNVRKELDTTKKKYSSLKRRAAYVDGGGGSVPRTTKRMKQVDSELDSIFDDSSEGDV